MPTFADITTFKVGGPIARLVHCATADEFVATVADLARVNQKFVIIGGGSNILGSDEGYDGTLVTPTFSNVVYQDQGDEVIVAADAGAYWDTLVADTVARGLWGLENLSGIPGTVGGAAVQNIGAYGAVLSSMVVSIDVFDIRNGKEVTLSVAECAYGYRTSVFKQTGGYAVVRVRLRLSRTARPNLGYKDLAALPNGTSLTDIRDAVLAIRAHKFPNLAEWGTAGSFFLNPIVSADAAQAAQIRFPGMPVFVLPEGGVKVPLAWILDHVIEAKGMHEGGAHVWEAQPLVIATAPGATARDVRTLAEKISLRVKEETNFVITPEVFLFA